jgi:endonuclease/exonuclease/phosphatase family metal-dependent hydrolase
MRVLSYNICGSRARRNPAHVECVAAVIRAARPDIAGLQEVYQDTCDGPHGDQPGRLAELTGLQHVFWPHLSPRGTSYGNAVLTRGTIGPAAMYRLPNRMLQLRALLEVTIELDGLALDFFCTHLVHFGFLMSRARRQQLAEVARRVSLRERPRILVGDLNTGWGNLDMEGLARVGLYPICARELRTYPARRPRFCFDHIFASPTWQCREVRVIPIPASDHLALLAELVPAEEPVVAPAWRPRHTGHREWRALPHAAPPATASRRTKER